ncbi:MAG: PEP-CTERM sorting domain-containing protein [Sedimentisphaerales bacterium]
MKKSAITCVLVLLVCLGLISSARATIVDANEEWERTLLPGESFTCLAHFIPGVPGVIPESVIFTRPPEWTSTYPVGWDTAVIDGGKIAYLYGPRLTNNTSDTVYVFSFKLFYQWDTDAEGFDANYPVYQDVAIFDDLTLTYTYGGWRGIPWERHEETWREHYYPGSEPYENPVPEPMTICLLGLGAAFLRKSRRRSNLSGVAYAKSEAMATERR